MRLTLKPGEALRLACDNPANALSVYIGHGFVHVRPPLPADIEAAVELAREFCADPDKRAQVRVQLAANGWPQLADMINEAVTVSRALLRVCGRE